MTNHNQKQQAAAHKRRQSVVDYSGSLITEEQWAQITEELQGYFCHVQFKYQDTVISVARQRDGESRTILSVYFDRKMCAGWGFADHEVYNPITRLFWHEKKKRYYTAKRVAEIEKLFGKRAAKKDFPKLHDSMSYWVPYFISSTNLVRQFKKAEGLIWLHEKDVNNEE